MPTRSNLDSFKTDHIPKGWRECKGANASPSGWAWFCNGKSRFGGEYEHALVPETIAEQHRTRQAVH